MERSINSRKRFKQLFQRKPFTTTNANSHIVVPLSFNGDNSPININISQDGLSIQKNSSIFAKINSSVEQRGCKIRKRFGYATAEYGNNWTYSDASKTFFTQSQKSHIEEYKSSNGQQFNPFSRKKNKYISNINQKLKERIRLIQGQSQNQAYNKIQNRNQNQNFQPILINNDLNTRFKLQNDQKNNIQRTQSYRKNQDYIFKCRQQLLFQKLVRKRKGINQSTQQYKKRRSRIRTQTLENSPREFKNSQSQQSDLKSLRTMSKQEEPRQENKNYQTSMNININIPVLNFKQSEKDNFSESLLLQNECSSRKKISQTSREPIINSQRINKSISPDQINFEQLRNTQSAFEFILTKKNQNIELQSLRQQQKRLKTNKQKRQKGFKNNNCHEFNIIISGLKKDQFNNNSNRNQNEIQSFYKQSNILLQSQLLQSTSKNLQMQEKVDIMSKMIKELQIKVISLENQKYQTEKKNNQLIQNLFKKKQDDKNINSHHDSFNSSFNPPQVHYEIACIDRSKHSQPDSLEKLTIAQGEENNKTRSQDTPRFLLNSNKYSYSKKSLGHFQKNQEDSLLNFLNNTNNSKFSSLSQHQGSQQQPHFGNQKLFSQGQQSSKNQSRESKSSEDIVITNLLDDIKNLKRKDFSDAIQQIYNQQIQNIFTLKNIPLDNSQTNYPQKECNNQLLVLDKEYLQIQNTQDLISQQLKDFMKENQILKNQILTLQARLQFQVKKIQILQNQLNSTKSQLNDINQKQSFYQEQILNMKDVLDKMKNTNKNLFGKIKEVNQEKQKIQEICQNMHQEYTKNLEEMKNLQKVNQQLQKQKIELRQAMIQFQKKHIRKSSQNNNNTLPTDESNRTIQSQAKLQIKQEGQKQIELGSNAQIKKIQNYDLILNIFGISSNTINHNQILMKKIVLFQNNIIKITSKLASLEQHIFQMQRQEQQLKQQNFLLRNKVKELSLLLQSFQVYPSVIAEKVQYSLQQNENIQQTILNQSLKQDSLSKQKSSSVFKSSSQKIQEQSQEENLKQVQKYQKEENIEIEQKEQEEDIQKEQSIDSVQINNFLNQ